MTLHWWMHWFWITRPVAVATQLLFLLAAVQTVPLPASTLYPQVQSSHNSRTPASSWVSDNDPTFVNDRPTSVYSEQQRQTVVYENGPIWSSSPDIEEPFYPTTASSDRLANSDLPTENIPVTSKSISNHELHSETYPPSHDENDQSGSTNPTEFTLQNHAQHQAYFEEPMVQTHSSIAEGLQTEKSGEQSLEDLAHYHDNWNVEEPRALPLGTSPIERPQITDPSASSKAAPKNLYDSTLPNSGEDESSHGHVNLNKNTNIRFLNTSVSNFSVEDVQDRKHGLVTRDLSNVSEPVLSFESSHGINSTNSGNSSLRPSIRASKAIGHFPHASIAESLDSKKDQVPDPGKVENEGKSIQSNPDLENAKHEDSKDSPNDKITSDDTKYVPNTAGINGGSNNSTGNSSFPIIPSGSENPHPIHEDEQLNSRRSKLESDSSKLASEIKNKSHENSTSLNIKSTTSEKGLIVSSANATSQNSSMLSPHQKENSPHESATPFGGDISDRITTLSDAEEIGSLIPAQIHEEFGRSASLSHEEDTTVEPSIAPVSKSRVAASPPNIPNSGLDAASITGIALGIVVFAGLAGAVSFVLYRRRYLNKPQTLNDKCSNPDSSGYIDDSTLRENSEEMYSLDNDSFLNSLEAMTIQNYWTDNVKHTKL